MTTATAIRTIQAGDILCASWGYDQTNYTFFKVLSISKTGTTATVQELKSELVGYGEGMTKLVAPSEVAAAEPIRRKLKAGGTVVCPNDYMFARIWKGRPEQATCYA